MRIVIPFLISFQEPMVTGKKLMTCRTRIYGKPGDVFAVFGKDFVIEQVSKITLGEAKKHYLLEGVESPEEFQRIWEMLHPIKSFDESTEVYAHRFREATIEETRETFR